jgi:perosamine synthetase
MTAVLALQGGSRVVTTPSPHFTWPPITAATERAVLDQLRTTVSIYDRSGIIADLENDLAAYHDVAYALLTNSGTSALHSMFAACGIRAGDEVIVPAYTFFATVTPLLHLGAVPVLADASSDGNLDPDDVTARITHRTVALVVTHMWGAPAQAPRLREIADRHGLLLLEDASHAHGASIDARKVGTFGHAAAFSLNGPKPLSAGEGGFLLTDDGQIYRKALIHGQYNKRCRDEIPDDHPLAAYSTTGQGLKLRIHPLAAAIASQQLGHLDDYLDGRQACANYFSDLLAECSGITTPTMPTGFRSSWYGYIARYDEVALGGLPIERYLDALIAEGAQDADRPGSTCPLNLLPLFQNPKELFPDLPFGLAYRPGQYPRAEEFHRNSIKVPVWHRPDDLTLVASYAEAFQKVSAHHSELLG